MSNLPKAVTWKRTGRDSNPRPFGSRANALPLRHTGRILLPGYLMNGLNNFDKNGREYSLTFTDDPVGLWGQRSRSH